MVELTGFSASSCRDASVLILGSMPGSFSLEVQEYYAHPRNMFWQIMGELLGFDANEPYTSRLARLKRSGIALWDVVHLCVRRGSLDHAIQSDSVVVNDFSRFFKDHPCVRAIFFNGSKAETLFKRYVRSDLPLKERVVVYKRLPSTSPAHASMTYKEKLAYWNIIRKTLEKHAGN